MLLESVDEKYDVEQYVEQTFEVEYGNNTEAEAGNRDMDLGEVGVNKCSGFTESH